MSFKILINALMKMGLTKRIRLLLFYPLNNFFFFNFLIMFFDQLNGNK